MDDEHKLRTQPQTGKITEEQEHERLRDIEAQLDAAVGPDAPLPGWPSCKVSRRDQVQAHAVDEVEHYLQ